MASRDLLNEREPKPPAATGLATAFRAVEGLEYLLALPGRNAGATIHHGEDRVIRIPSHGDFNRWRAVLRRVVDEVSNHAAQQGRIAQDVDRGAFDRRVDMRGFLGREAEQIDLVQLGALFPIVV